MSKTVFVSVGLEDSHHYPAIDKIAAQYTLRALWEAAQSHNHILVVRSHPAVESFLEALTELSGFSRPAFASVPEAATADEIAGQFNLAAAVFIGGSGGMLKDFETLSGRSGIILMPLPGTGGVAERIEQEQRQTGAIPAMVLALAHEDPFCFDRIHALMKPVSRTQLPSAP